MHNCALFSIKPEFVQAIFSEKKRYEFRKRSCKQEIFRIIIYETSPTSKIVGEASVSDVIVDSPLNLWMRAKSAAGISKESFDKYFFNCTEGTAYSLCTPIRYKKAVSLSIIGMTVPPQSYCYLSKEQYQKILSFIEEDH